MKSSLFSRDGIWFVLKEIQFGCFIRLITIMPLVMFYQRIKTEVVRMFTKWDPFIIEMENNKSHPLSWRGIMTMIIRVIMILLSLLLIFYRPHLLSCAAHGGDFHPSTPFNHQPPLQWRNILTNFYPLNYIFIQGIGWIFKIYFFVSCGMHKDQIHQCGVLFWSFFKP